MKNIEYYYHTKDALEAWRQSREGGVFLSFDEWAQREYEAPREQTLLEAAEAVKNEWYTTFPNVMPDTLCEKIVDLAKAADREKSKPVRNCDRYKTAKEAIEAFDKMFLSHCWSKCNGCPIGEQKVKVPTSNCMFLWLYAEAEKEAK